MKRPTTVTETLFQLLPIEVIGELWDKGLVITSYSTKK